MCTDGHIFEILPQILSGSIVHSTFSIVFAPCIFESCIREVKSEASGTKLR